MTATLLVLLSALTHAAWNAVLKRQKETSVAAVCIVSIAALTATLAALVVRTTAFPTLAALGWAIVAGLAEAGYFVTLARSLERAPLGAAYTISRGGSTLVVWPLSIALFGEPVSSLGIAGCVLIVTGLAATGASSGGPSRAHGSREKSGLWYAVGCAVLISLVYLAYKRALGAGCEPKALFAVSMLIAIPVNVVALGARGVPRIFALLRASPITLVVSGIVCAASFLLFLDALGESGTGRVLTLRNTSVIFAQVFAWFMGERPKRVQLVGVALVAAGALLLGLG